MNKRRKGARDGRKEVHSQNKRTRGTDHNLKEHCRSLRTQLRRGSLIISLQVTIFTFTVGKSITFLVFYGLEQWLSG